MKYFYFFLFLSCSSISKEFGKKVEVNETEAVSFGAITYERSKMFSFPHLTFLYVNIENPDIKGHITIKPSYYIKDAANLYIESEDKAIYYYLINQKVGKYKIYKVIVTSKTLSPGTQTITDYSYDLNIPFEIVSKKAKYFGDISLKNTFFNINNYKILNNFDRDKAYFNSKYPNVEVENK